MGDEVEDSQFLRAVERMEASQECDPEGAVAGFNSAV